MLLNDRTPSQLSGLPPPTSTPRRSARVDHIGDAGVAVVRPENYNERRPAGAIHQVARENASDLNLSV
jgi:hypothetical protein